LFVSQALSRFRHKNIAALFAFTNPLAKGTPDSCHLLYELAEKGSLDKFLADDLGRGRLGSFQRRVQIAIDVLTAIRFLHEGSKDKVITACFHRDVKSANIVIKRDFTAQLIDCGLAKFLNEEQTSMSTSTIVGIKGTPGYIDPEYVSTGEYTAACDIYSFGVVLLELWTGRLQNHIDESGCKFSFGQQYIRRRRDVSADVDAALDLDDLPPGFSTRYTDLALKCIADWRDNRPAGEKVFEELTSILGACSPIEGATQASVDPDSPEACPTCRTMPVIPRLDMCAVCLFREEIRKAASLLYSRNQAPGTQSDQCLSRQIEELGRQLVISTDRSNMLVEDTRRVVLSTTTTSRLVAGMSNKDDTMLPVVAHLDRRLNHQIPRTFILIPADIKSGWTHPRSWLRSRVQKKYYLFFVCAASQKVVSPPIKLKVAKDWICKIAPILATSLYLLKMSMKVGLNVNLDLDGVASVLFEISSSHIAELLNEVTEILEETNNRGLRDRLELLQLSDNDVRELSGDAYELLLEKASEQIGWRSAMETVRTPSSPAVLWVTKEVAADPMYEIVRA
jgi:serine/threonine protein kinase